MTVTVLALVADSVRVTIAFVVPVFPSFSDRSAIEMEGNAASSLTIVTTACASAMVALTGDVRLTKNVSFDSAVVSPLTGMLIVVDVVPAVNVAVPDPAV